MWEGGWGGLVGGWELGVKLGGGGGAGEGLEVSWSLGACD